MTPFGPDLDQYTPTEVDTITLSWLRYGASALLPAEVGSTLDARVYRESMLNHVVYSLAAQVLGTAEQAAPVTVSKVFDWKIPASPWQVWKKRHADTWWAGWLVRLRPVRVHREVRIGELTIHPERHVTWPAAPVVPDAWGGPVQVARYNPRGVWKTP